MQTLNVVSTLKTSIIFVPAGDKDESICCRAHSRLWCTLRPSLVNAAVLL